MFLINHWLRPDGPPDPAAASHVNSRSVLLDRFRTCAAERERLPNVIAVDFTGVGAFQSTVRDLNGAIASVTGVTDVVEKSVKSAFNSGALTEAEAREIRGLHRLPSPSAVKARTILGAAAGYLTRPTALDKLEADNWVKNARPTGLEPGPPIPAPFDAPLDPNPACEKAGPAGVTTASTTRVP